MNADAALKNLAARIVDARPEERVIALAERHFIETIGVGLSGVRERSVQATLGTLSPVAGDAGARSLVAPQRLSIRDAALCNGVAVHAHDFDDDEPHVIVGHPSVAVVSALLALADARALSFERALHAYVIGVETQSRLGAMLNPQHYNAGWHCTATLGVFGAAAACGVAQSFSTAHVEAALNLAATLSGGLKENFGSDVKPLQVGIAAGNGIWATELARTGLQASASALFGSRGFLKLMGSPGAFDGALDRFGRPWAVEQPGINVKVYPCCSSTHTALDAVLGLRAEQRWVADDVEQVDVWIGEDVPAILIHDVPTTGLEGKFSMRYCIAVALTKGEVGLGAFTDAALSDVAVRRVLDRVRVHTDPKLPRVATGVTHQSRVRVTTRVGQVAEREVVVPLGSADAPCSREQLAAKFMSCAAFGLGDERATRIEAAIAGLRRTDPLSRIVDAVHAETS